MLRADDVTQATLFAPEVENAVEQPGMPPLKGQLLKWIGNKQKFALEIVAKFPKVYGTYFEPFIGSGGVLATLAPKQAVAGDVFKPLVEIWQKLHDDTEGLIRWYEERHSL